MSCTTKPEVGSDEGVVSSEVSTREADASSPSVALGSSNGDGVLGAAAADGAEGNETPTARRT